MNKIGVIGIGNPLRKDDGIGIILLERLMERKNNLPKNIEFIDGGTGGMNLLHILARFRIALILDAVKFGGEVGEYKIFKPNETVNKRYLTSISTHGLDFLKIVNLSKDLGELPKELIIFGVQPKDVSNGVDLSPELQNKVDELLKILEKILQKYGVKS